MDGEEPSDVDLQKAIRHAEDAIEFVDKTEANFSIEASHDEYLVIARLDESRIASVFG
jgi:ATP-dependent helicase/nuclease subunit A